MTEREPLLATWCARMWDLGRQDYSATDEKRKAERRLRDLGRDYGLVFGASDRRFWPPGGRRRFYEAGQAIVRDYLVPGSRLPYDPGDAWCGLYSRQERAMWAWVEGVSDYSANLDSFLHGPDAFPSGEDIVDPVLIDLVVSRYPRKTEKGRRCGYRNARVIREALRDGETSRNLSNWIDAALILKGCRNIFTRAVIYGNGLSPPLKSLLLSGYAPLAYHANVYRNTDVLPGDNLGAIFMVRYDRPELCADYFFGNIRFMTEFLRLPAMQHVLTSLGTSSRN